MTASATVAMVDDGRETRLLKDLARPIKHDLEEITGEEIERLASDWVTIAAPWASTGGSIRLFRSHAMDGYVKKALQHRVQPEETMGMTQQLLLQELQERCPGVGVCIMGGFVRDAVQGNEGNDIDLAFVTNDTGIKAMADCAEKKGWEYTALTPSQQKLIG